MKRILPSLLACFCSINMAGYAEASTVDDLKMFIGTYTEGSTSTGIYVFSFNQKTGSFKELSNIEAHNPSFLTISADKKRLYAVSEYNDGRQGAYSFDINAGHDKLSNPVFKHNYPALKQENSGDKQGGDPCHICRQGEYVITANYTGGDISVYQLDGEGRLSRLAQYHSFADKTAQAKSHIHCIIPSPDGKYIFVTDLGMNCIYRLHVNHGKAEASNAFIDKPEIAYQGSKGMGPRHLTFSPDGKHAYLINELGGECIAFEYNDGKLTEIQKIMADEGKGHGSADIHVSPDGRFLYASHRLKKDGISIFSINQQNGKLTKIGYQKTGKHPRNFNITPNGQFLLVACRDNDMIQVFKRDINTGKLSKTSKTIKLGKPVCIQFLQR